MACGTRTASMPVTFDGTVGLFSPAIGDAKPAAVLFAAPWGLEEMCTRKFFRILAEGLALKGIASLRFDYAGTGDSLKDSAAVTELQRWLDGFAAAAGQLKLFSGCERVVIVAQGIGAAVAVKALNIVGGFDAAVFLAPVVSGRSYLREMSVLSQMINDRLDLGEASPTGGGLTVAGLAMSESLATDIKRIDLTRLDRISLRHALVFSRTERPADSAFADHLRKLGVEVRQEPFDGYAKLASNPTLAVVPEEVVSRLVGWVDDLYSVAPPTHPAVEPPVALHGADGFMERPMRFGEGDRMYGILCRPAEKIRERTVTVLLLSSGYDRLSGWGRSSTKAARALAAQGICSLRFDCGNVADSPPSRRLDGQVLYHPLQIEDVVEAIAVLERHVPGTEIVVAGRCSGAYLGLQASWVDDRIAGVVAVNPQVYAWPSGQSVDDALANPVQSMDHYFRSVQNLAVLKKIARGDVDLSGKLLPLAKAMACRAFRPLVRLIGGVTTRERSVCSGFRTLAKRAARVHLLYSAGDIGLEEFGHFFGTKGERLNRFPNMACTLVPDADHNFTSERARQAWLAAIFHMVEILEKRT